MELWIMNKSQIRILQVGGYPLYRFALTESLRRLSFVCEVELALDETNCLFRLMQQKFDLVLVDWSGTHDIGVNLLSTIKQLQPEQKVAFVGPFPPLNVVREVMQLGACGYLLESIDEHSFAQAIFEMVQSDQIYLSPALSNQLKRVEQKLRPREMEVLIGICEGKSSRELAELLHLSIYTINSHRASIIRKIGTSKVLDIYKWAVSSGVLQA